MRQQRNILREIAKDNRGSGIVMVLVCMLCVTLMGAAMLSMSYTGLRIKVAQRQAEKDFYSAETAVDEIRAGIQGLVSEAIGEAYKEVLINYNDGVNVVSRFQEEFRDNLKASSVLTASTYDVASLQAFVSNSSAVVSGNDPTDSSKGTLVPDNVKNTLTLKGMKVSYTAANNYVTEIETDLVISVPDFAYVMSTYSISGLPEHALIAKTALEQIAGNSVITIDGSAYAGKIVLQNAGSQMTLKDGTMVCAQAADISGSGRNGMSRFQVTDNARLWAERIVVAGGSSVELGGETCVLDDLDLSGAGAKATLRGSYYGFGNGTTDNGSGSSADRSSAILVNGRDSTLDMSGLNRLMLAGRSFISNTFFAGDTASANVETLESVSVRSNQKMYLIPAEYLAGASSNPYIHASGEGTSVTLTEAGSAQLGAWGASMKSLTAALPGAGGQQITYYFMDFVDKDSASAYFEQYFASHSGAVSSYLTNGSNLNAKNSGAAGYTLRGKDGSYTVSRSGGIGFDCTGMRSTFNQMKKTLIDSNTNPGADNPYDYIVNTAEVLRVRGTRKFVNAAGDIVGLVVNGEDYDVNNSTPSTVRLIIANNSHVTVKKNFTGLIICGRIGDGTYETDKKGVITIEGDVNVTANEMEVVASFDGVATDDSNVTLGSYLLHGGNQSGAQGGAGGGSAGWNLDKLVTYRNWTKNG